ncbi:MAG TPA: sigma-54 dependent transcriptional regulator [Myxococcota bacterium]|nr:sigma-54 dependent transcriptional regulator [Myxococcota bacterium]
MSHASILIVDDDTAVSTVLAALCRQRGYTPTIASSGASALAAAQAEPFDLAIVDLRMPGMSGLEVLERIKALSPETAVVMLTAHGTVDDAVRAMKLGATEFMQKPFDRDELFFVVERALAVARRDATTPPSSSPAMLDGLLGNTPAMREVAALVKRAAASNATVLVRGESGTGKELVARAIHTESRRRQGPFVKIHCAALPDNLLESELFGYEKGAFTGATQRKPGRIELAQGGTVFLDEIGDISPATQVKLLRVLQDKQLERLGGTQTVEVDVRFVTATHRDLERMVAERTFREDLFYRLNVVPIWTPPLRDRRDDIPLLARSFFESACREHERTLTFSPGAIEALAARDWPGNVRELKNALERLVVLAPGPAVTEHDVERELGRDRRQNDETTPVSDLRDGLELAELRHIEATLQRCNNNRTTAARLLGISRRTLYNKLARHGLA